MSDEAGVYSGCDEVSDGAILSVRFVFDRSAKTQVHPMHKDAADRCWYQVTQFVRVRF